MLALKAEWHSDPSKKENMPGRWWSADESLNHTIFDIAGTVFKGPDRLARLKEKVVAAVPEAEKNLPDLMRQINRALSKQQAQDGANGPSTPSEGPG